ncbi:hypothetical protein FRC17_004945 [Serendipita sp. 399]|nr:hypothetical protein FRC17_004945 [Serendipita sp. 399]
MISECQVLELALQKVKNIQSASAVHPERADIRQGLERTLGACLLTLDALQDDIKSLNTRLGDSKQGQWHVTLIGVAKFKYLWKEKVMATYLGQLRGQHTAIQLLLQAFTILSGTKKLPKEVQSLRYSVALHLLAHNDYELDQTLTEIEYLCDPSYFAGAPIISLKTLRGADYDVKETISIFNWLRNVYEDDAARARTLEENDFRVNGIKSSFEMLYSILYDRENTQQIAEVFKLNEFSTKKLLRQHDWAKDLINEAPEAQAILRLFISRGWSISRLQKLLGLTPAERLETLHSIGENEEEEIGRCLDKMHAALEGFKEKTQRAADNLFRTLSFSLDVGSHLQKLRDIAADEWGMLLLLAFVNKDKEHSITVALQAYATLRDFIHQQDAVFLEVLLTYFQQEEALDCKQFAGYLVAIRNQIVVHLHAGVTGDVSTAFEYVLYAVCTSKLNFTSVIDSLRSPYNLKDYMDTGERASALNSTVQAVREATQGRQRVGSVRSFRSSRRLRRPAQIQAETSRTGVLYPIEEPPPY